MKYSSQNCDVYLALAERHAFTVYCRSTPIDHKFPLERAGLDFFCIFSTLVWIFPGECQSSDNHPILRGKNLCCVWKAKRNDNDQLLGLWCQGLLFGRELQRAKKNLISFIYVFWTSCVMKTKEPILFPSLFSFAFPSLCPLSLLEWITPRMGSSYQGTRLLKNAYLVLICLSPGWLAGWPHPLEWVSLPKKTNRLKSK